MLASKERASDQEQLSALMAGGAVVPSVDSTYPLDHVHEAMRRLESGDVMGKIAITI